MKSYIATLALILSSPVWAQTTDMPTERSIEAAECNPTRRYTGLLGSTELNYLGDSDTISINSCTRLDSEVRRVKIKVVEGSAYIQSIRVYFANGTTDDLNVRSYFSRGSDSRWIDIEGGTRCISQIRVIGRSRLTGQKAHVQVWGYMSPQND